MLADGSPALPSYLLPGPSEAAERTEVAENSEK